MSYVTHNTLLHEKEEGKKISHSLMSIKKFGLNFSLVSPWYKTKVSYCLLQTDRKKTADCCLTTMRRKSQHIVLILRMDLLNSLHQKARVVKITLLVSQQTLDSVTYSKARSKEKKPHCNCVHIRNWVRSLVWHSAPCGLFLSYILISS